MREKQNRFIGLGKLGLPHVLVESRGHSVVGYDPSQQVKEIVDTEKLQYQEIFAQEHLEKSKIQIKSIEGVLNIQISYLYLYKLHMVISRRYYKDT